ncbi:MAG: transaldolase [Chlamydiae bacterium CG10_big_fil_rev_8_21_14_0_10_35_9]|nr:MAG: transaldolase [Chlamydiae bacterium CG10_big_fil_rev_8_21_14_0_10_35_9]
MQFFQDLNIKIFADGADLNSIQKLSCKSWIQGFTTNPTLMRQSGVIDYETFAKKALAIVDNKPISFEVFADEFEEMEEQAHEIASWGSNIYVKIPITNTKGISSVPLIKKLSNAGIQVNVTAVFTQKQVDEVVENICESVPSILSIFAGRIADTGRDPRRYVEEAIKKSKNKKIEVLWASPREILNLVQANEIGCHIITLTDSLLKKALLIGKPLEQYSQETVQMFYNDAKDSEYSIASKCKVVL